ncbi:MAG: tetratricopeptide repeat protein [Planctomycetes bacterium]|nr:tetratricopeptide repeat protein [Planctomycetota bacterium]
MRSATTLAWKIESLNGARGFAKLTFSRPTMNETASNPRSLKSALVCAGAIAICFAACASGPDSSTITARDRAKAQLENANISVGTSNNVGSPLTGSKSSVAVAEENAARQQKMRNEVLRLRREQDAVYEKRADNATFVESYKTTDRNDSNKLYLYGRALGKCEQVEAAELEFRAAAAADERNPWPHEGLGICYHKLSQFDRAIASLKKAVEIDPQLAEAYLMLAQALESARRMDEAVQAAESCIKCDSDAARGPILLARLRNARNEFDKTIAALVPAVEKAPENESLRFLLAEAYVRVGKTEEAVAQLDAAKQKVKFTIDRLFDVADYYRKAERFDRSIEFLERLLKEAPDGYWKTHSRDDINATLEEVRMEQKIGHRTKYTVEELCNMLVAHPDITKRRMAADALRQFPFPAIDQVYVQALHDAVPEIRMVAVVEVARRAKELSLKALAVLSAKDHDEGVRAIACAMLATLDFKESQIALVGAIGDDSPRVRVAANKGLESMTGRIVLPLGVESTNEEQRKTAQEEWRNYLSERKTKVATAAMNEVAPPAPPKQKP